jgi:hypothetical protein
MLSRKPYKNIGWKNILKIVSIGVAGRYSYRLQCKGLI